MAGDLVLWLWEETHVPKVVGLNPSTVYRVDIFTFICCKSCNDVCLKRQKKTKKRPRMAHFFKKNIHY